MNLWFVARRERVARDWKASPPQTNGEQLRMIRERQQLRTGLKVTQRAAAAIVGLEEDNYRAVEYDVRQLKESEARRLAEAWGEDWRDMYLRQIERPRPHGAGATPAFQPTIMAMVEVPLVGNVKAGDWTSPLESQVTEEIPADMYAPDVFASYIIGNSMEPFLLENDLAVFREAKGRQQVGDVVYVKNQDADVTVKVFRHDGILPYLHPLNPSYEDMYGIASEADTAWEVTGILVGYVRHEDGDILRRHNPKRLRPR